MRGLVAEVGGGGVASHAGSAALRMLAHKTGLTGALSGAPQTKTLRYRLLRTSARLIKGGRRLRIRIPATWPWADQLANAINTVLAMPAPT
jgi:hypothetical protein